METPSIKAFNYRIDDGFLWSEVNLKGEKKYYVEGYASTVDEDKAGEIVSYTAQEDIYNQIIGENITMDIEHEEWYNENGQVLPKPKNQLIPVAKVVNAELRPKGVWVKAEINRNLSKFEEVWGSIKEGFLKAFSIAFYPITKSGKTITKLNLVNITLTGSPVNPNATFAVSMKSAKAWMDNLENLSPSLTPQVLDDLSATEAVLIKSELKNSEEKPMEEEKNESLECKECDKKFESKEAFDKHKEEAHAKKEDVKAEEPKKEDSKEDKVEESEPKVKAEENVLDAEIKALKEENARLKAELVKPVMKALVEEVPKPVMVEGQIISPLTLATMLR
jgi:phage head maturation protease